MNEELMDPFGDFGLMMMKIKRHFNPVKKEDCVCVCV